MPNLRLAMQRVSSAAVPWLAGVLLGMASWWICARVSSRFEPYDSSAGLFANQLILSCGLSLLAWHRGALLALLALLGAYLGMNLYAYVFGGAELRVWAALGALTSIALLVVPALCIAIIKLYSHLRPEPH